VSTAIHQGSIEERIKKCIGEIMQRPPEDFKNSDRLDHDIGCDSIDLLEIVMSVEGEFDIEISDEDGEKLLTIQQAIDYVTAKVS